MRLIATRKHHQNRAAIDPWTLVHFSTGLALGLMAVSRRSSVGAAVAYELIEQVFERQEVGQRFFETSGPEEVMNAVVDVVVFAAGHALGERWNRTG
jgi:hypothetical protein